MDQRVSGPSGLSTKTVDNFVDSLSLNGLSRAKTGTSLTPLKKGAKNFISYKSI
jgi:hypothetical protein